MTRRDLILCTLMAPYRVSHERIMAITWMTLINRSKHETLQGITTDTSTQVEREYVRGKKRESSVQRRMVLHMKETSHDGERRERRRTA